METHLRWLGNHHLTVGGRFVRKTVDKYNALNSLIRFVWGYDFESPTSGETIPTTLGYVEVRKPYGYIFKRSVDSLALFLGDEWNPVKNLVLQLGVRLESDEVPSLSDDQVDSESPIRFGLLDRISPRLGFVYEWGDEKKTTIFGNYGVYFDTMKWTVAQERYGGFRWTSHYYDIVRPFWEEYHVVEQPNPSYMEGRYFESKDWGLTKVSETQQDIKPLQKHELSLGILKWLSADVELNVSFVHNWIKNAVEDIGVPYPDGLVYFIANPGSDWIQDRYNEAQELGTMPEGVESVDAVRRYTAITVRLDKRFSRRWLGGISYTWSRLYGNYSPLEIDSEKQLSEFDVWYHYYSGNAAEVDPQQIYLSPLFNAWYSNYNHNGEEVLGLLPTDRTHQIKAYGAYTFDFGLTVGFNAFAMSGTPVQTETPLNGVDGWHPYGRGDLGRTPWIWQLNTYLEYNLKLSHHFNLQLSLNIDNITNNDIARRVYQQLWWAVYIDPQLIFEGFKSIGDVAYNELYTDPRFKMERNFQPPIAARLGAKLLF